MLTREYCLEQAEICEEYAALTSDPRVRREWIETGRAWLEAAECEPPGSGGDVPGQLLFDGADIVRLPLAREDAVSRPTRSAGRRS